MRSTISVISCDIEGCTTKVTAPSDEEHRRWLEVKTWAHDGGEVCPNCVAKLKLSEVVGLLKTRPRC